MIFNELVITEDGTICHIGIGESSGGESESVGVGEPFCLQNLIHTDVVRHHRVKVPDSMFGILNQFVVGSDGLSHGDVHIDTCPVQSGG